MLGQEEILIKAKFDSKCINCNKEVFAGDSVLWTKGVGVRHQTCSNSDDSPEGISVEFERDPKDWKDNRILEYKEAKNFTKCQRCGDTLPEGKRWIQALEAGYRVTCSPCFDK